MSKYLTWKELERDIKKKLKRLGFKAYRCWSGQVEEGGGVDVRAEKRQFKVSRPM